jgi:hypothetical protein
VSVGLLATTPVFLLSLLLFLLLGAAKAVSGITATAAPQRRRPTTHAGACWRSDVKRWTVEN